MDVLPPLATISVAGFATIAGIIDLREFRVPNALTVPLLVCGIAYHTTTGGSAGLQTSLLGACFGFGILFGLYLLGAMGAGDVKLLAGVGAWLGAPATIYVFAIAATATGLYSLVVLALRGGLAEAVITIRVALLQFQAMAKHLGANERVEVTVTRRDRRKRLVPFATMVALGVIVVLAWNQWG